MSVGEKAFNKTNPSVVHTVCKGKKKHTIHSFFIYFYHFSQLNGQLFNVLFRNLQVKMLKLYCSGHFITVN